MSALLRGTKGQDQWTWKLIKRDVILIHAIET
jgi:hypothetical protein